MCNEAVLSPSEPMYIHVATNTMPVISIESKGPASPPNPEMAIVSTVFIRKSGVAVAITPERIALNKKNGESNNPTQPPRNVPMKVKPGSTIAAAIDPQMQPSRIDVPKDESAISARSNHHTPVVCG
jgi:hypothetical protein